jgi:hypothetical protein
VELFRGTPYDYFAVAPEGPLVFTAGACPLDAEGKVVAGADQWRYGEYRSSVAWMNRHTAIAVGPSDSDVSTNGGRTRAGFEDGPFDTVDGTRPTACCASGEQSRVAYLAR